METPPQDPGQTSLRECRQSCVPVDDLSQVGAARRQAVAAAAAKGWTEADTGGVALVATELATNLARHAQQGRLLIRPLAPLEGGGLELLSLDAGPGMADVSTCLRDGHSSAGTPGEGLGAVQRAAKEFAITSRPGEGTLILARLGPRTSAANTAPPEDRPPLRLGVICQNYPGETACGDAWFVAKRADRTVAAVVDGLGHGPDAEAAALAAVEVLSQHADLGAVALMERMHAALRSTRGAAAAIALLHHREERLEYTGLGNIAGRLWIGGEYRSLISLAGTVGHAARRIRTESYPLPPGAVLMLASDGLKQTWDPAPFRLYTAQHPALFAGALYRALLRGRDDATVLVLGAAPRGGD